MKNNLLIFLVVFFVIGGCSSIANLMDGNKLMRIHIGMSKAEVQRIFGQPGYRTMDNQREEWKYKYGTFRGGEPSGYDFYQFVFHQDTVESFDSWFVPENSLVTAGGSTAVKKKNE